MSECGLIGAYLKLLSLALPILHYLFKELPPFVIDLRALCLPANR